MRSAICLCQQHRKWHIIYNIVVVASYQKALLGCILINWMRSLSAFIAVELEIEESELKLFHINRMKQIALLEDKSDVGFSRQHNSA